MLFFCLHASRDLGERVGASLGIRLAEHEEREFEDGEHKTRPLVSVRGRDVYVLQSLYGGPSESVNDKLCRLLFFIGALKDAGADRVTAVTPYLCFARKDRRTKSRDPVTTRYVAQLFEAVGTDALMVVEVHNLAAFQNAFRIRTETLDARRPLSETAAALIGNEAVAVVSPDPGGVARAERFREALEARLRRQLDKAFMDKHRSSGVVSGETLVGEVAGKTVVVVDDLISTGGTLLRCAEACRRAGARRVVAVATHGLFMSGSEKVIASESIDDWIETDTVPPFRLDEHLASSRLRIVSIVPLLAEAIRRAHDGGSISELLQA
jgi:ribose-phosphate pyrophosphokinase